MSTTFILSINYAVQRLTIFYGIPIFILGVLGAILNLLVFLTSRTFREKSCIFYLIVISILDLIRLFTSTLPNIVSWGFDIDWTRTSLAFCKIKVFIFTICALGSITCLCLAIIDQYLATCFRPQWQKWCNLKIAHRLTSCFLFLWFLHGIPYFIFYNHIVSPSTNKTICQITNPAFIQYHTYGYFVVLTNILPLITVIIGVLAYRNSQQLVRQKIPVVRRELDNQLTKMVLIQIFVYICTFLPYTIQSMCALLIQNNDIIFQMKMKLISIITIYLAILNYTSSFYIYVCVSKCFRQHLKYILYEKYFKEPKAMQLTTNEDLSE